MTQKRTLTIIKLGGALLTDKTVDYTSKDDIIIAVANEIKDCIDAGLIEDLILVHGVGSFGHPPVLEHNLHKGFHDKKQLIPMAKTQQVVNHFRADLARELTKAGIPVSSLHASSLCVNDKMEIQQMFIEPIQGFLSLGMVPFLGGDMIFDRKMGFSVGSGDQLAAVLARELNAANLILATDVPGIYSKDPKKNADAVLVTEISCRDLSEKITVMDLSEKRDASGSMRGKLRVIQALEKRIQTGLEVSILSMVTPENLRKLLKRKLAACTRFVP